MKNLFTFFLGISVMCCFAISANAQTETDAPFVESSQFEFTENETGDSVTAVFTLTYNTDVQLYENFTIATHYHDNEEWVEFDQYDETEVAVEGNVLTITPVRAFSSSGLYELIVASGSVQDLNGVNAGPFTRTFIADEGAPNITNYEVVLDETEFADSLTATFTITYDEPVQLGPGYQFLTYQLIGADLEEYEVITESGIDVTGNTVTVSPERMFSTANSYQFVVTSGSVTDLAGNVGPSFTDVFMVDTIRPLLIEMTPDITVPVATDAVFTFTFSENVRLPNNIGFYTYVWNGETSQFDELEHLEASQVTVDGNVVSFDPAIDFPPAQRIQIILVGGAVLDMAGNRYLNVLGEDTLNYVSVRFWSADSEAEGITFMPADGETISYLPEALNIAFNREVVLHDTIDIETAGYESLVYLRHEDTDLEFEVSFDSASYALSIVPAEELAYGNTYTYGFTAGFLDDAGEDIPAQEATFSIVDSVVVVEDRAIAEVYGEGEVSPFLGQVVRITGTVTGVYPDEGFFVQDDNAVRSGIWVEYANTGELETGDGVIVTGLVEMTDYGTVIIAEEVTETDAPIAIEPIVVDFATDSVAMYNGVVVQFAGLRASAANEEGDWYLFTEDDADSVLVSGQMYAYEWVADNLFDLTGVVTSRDGVYRIEPRFEADVVDVTTPTSVDISPAVDINIYPNPFTNYVRISNHEQVTRVVISNIAGQRVVDISNPRNEISTSHLISGIYIINLFNEKELLKTSRIVKQ